MARPHPSLYDVAADRVRPVTVFPTSAYQSAGEHRVNGLVIGLIGKGVLEVDPVLRRESVAAGLVIKARNLKLWDEAEAVTSTLGDAGIETAVFKGIATEARYYPGPATRPAADLDLVVAPDALSRFGEAIRLLQPDHRLLDDVDDLVERDLIQSVDVRLPSGVWVDLHVDAVKTGISLRSREAMWERTEYTTGPDGRSIRVLHSSDAMVQAVIHQLKDRFSLLRGHADVARILGSGTVDWDVVADLLETDRLASLFWPALSIILDELNLPALVAPTPSIGTASVNRLWPPPTRLQGHTGIEHKVRAKHAIPFLIKGRKGAAVRHFWRVLFPPRAMMTYQHPDYRGPYPWRLMSMRFSFARSRHLRRARNRRIGFD